MGALPIRDIRRLLPDVTDHFAAEPQLIRLAARHHALWCRDNGGAQATADARNRIAPRVHAQAGLGHPLDLREHLALLNLAQADAQWALRVVVHHLLVADSAVLLQYRG